jgi:hypothetical protein
MQLLEDSWPTFKVGARREEVLAWAAMEEAIFAEDELENRTGRQGGRRGGNVDMIVLLMKSENVNDEMSRGRLALYYQ